MNNDGLRCNRLGSVSSDNSQSGVVLDVNYLFQTICCGTQGGYMLGNILIVKKVNKKEVYE